MKIIAGKVLSGKARSEKTRGAAFKQIKKTHLKASKTNWF